MASFPEPEAGTDADAAEDGPRGGYQVHTALFEGPLDLLLYLVSKQKLDLTEMSLSRVAEEYWSYLKMLEQLDLDVESSYLVVFACLLEIKSRLLLPPDPEPQDFEDFDLGDTAEHDLVERLKEYKRYKEASRALQEREKEAMQVFPRPFDEESVAIEPTTLDVSLPDLLEALRGVLETHQKKTRQQQGLRVERVNVSVPQRMRDLLAQLEPGRTVEFFHLFAEEVTRADVIVTFLAILELARLRRIRIWQEARSGPIHVERSSDDVSDLLLPEEATVAAKPARRTRRKPISDGNLRLPFAEFEEDDQP